MRIQLRSIHPRASRRLRRIRAPREPRQTIHQAPEPRVWSLLLPPGYSRRP